MLLIQEVRSFRVVRPPTAKQAVQRRRFAAAGRAARGARGTVVVRGRLLPRAAAIVQERLRAPQAR